MDMLRNKFSKFFLVLVLAFSLIGVASAQAVEGSGDYNGGGNL